MLHCTIYMFQVSLSLSMVLRRIGLNTIQLYPKIPILAAAGAVARG